MGRPAAALGFVTGLVFEADCLNGAAKRLDLIPPPPVRCLGPGPLRAAEAAFRLVDEGVTALISFGVAGALAPSLGIGDLCLPEAIMDGAGRSYPCDALLRLRVSGMLNQPAAHAGLLFSLAEPAATPAAKHEFYKSTGADAVDMESAAIAEVASRNGLPFIALRVILDHAGAVIPPSAMRGMRPDGTTDALATIMALLRRPADLPALVQLPGLTPGRAKP